MAKLKPIPAADDTVRGCLEKIRRGEVTAVGVLADYMEERQLPGWKRVRAVYARYAGFIAFWQGLSDESMARRKYTRWERVAANRRAMVYRTMRLFGRDWKRLPLSAFTAKGA